MRRRNWLSRQDKTGRLGRVDDGSYSCVYIDKGKKGVALASVAVYVTSAQLAVGDEVKATVEEGKPVYMRCAAEL